MRIALICDWFAPRLGGIEAHLDGLATRLATKGHVVHVITSTPEAPRTSAPGIQVHRLAAPLVPWAGVVFQPSPIREIGSILVREKIELAHAHVSIVAPVGIGGALEAQRLNLPTVVTFHSFVPATPLWAWLVGRLVGASHWNAIMTAVSSRVAREVGTFAPSIQFRILPNAIDTSFWTPGEPSPATGSINMVAVGRLNAKKRPMLLIDVMRELRRESSNGSVSLRIAGSGPLESSIRKAISREGLSDRVSLVGWQDSAGLRELLRGSDVFLAPAHRESFGLAALEARAVGLPVVAMRDSAIADFVEHETVGLLADDDKGFVEAAVRLVSDSSLRQRIAANNRGVATTMTWQRTVELHEAAYADAIQAHAK